MKLILRLVSSLLLWALMAFLVIMLVLLPRDTQSYRDGYLDVMSYHFTWDAYKNNITQYWDQVKEHKSLGITSYEQPVEVELLHYGLRSVKILIPAFLLSIVLGIYKGVFDYRHRSSLGRFFGKGVTWFGQSVPDFFLIFLIQNLLSIAMHYGLPRFDMYGDEKFSNIILPVIFLSMYPAFVIARYTSQALEEEDEQDYIKTARAKGVPEKAILWKHILRNCWPKLLQHFMPIVLMLLSGMFVVELLTSYRGIGTRLIYALNIKYVIMPGQSLPIDIPAVIGFSMAFMVLLLLAQMINQLINHYVVPVRKED